jgi:hypothetical protein
MREIWKPVVGFEGLYEISNKGRVKSLDRTEICERFKFGKWDKHSRVRPGGFVSIGSSRTGYAKLNLWKSGKMYTRFLHILLLEAFVGRRRKNQETRHLNGRRNDNRLINLVWGTHRENVADSIRHGTWVHGTMGNARLTEADVRKIRNARGTQRAIAEQFGVSQSTIWQIKSGNAWKHVQC